jgi:hypothetical protein
MFIMRLFRQWNSETSLSSNHQRSICQSLNPESFKKFVFLNCFPSSQICGNSPLKMVVSYLSFTPAFLLLNICLHLLQVTSCHHVLNFSSATALSYLCSFSQWDTSQSLNISMQKEKKSFMNFAESLDLFMF